MDDGPAGQRLGTVMTAMDSVAVAHPASGLAIINGRYAGSALAGVLRPLGGPHEYASGPPGTEESS